MVTMVTQREVLLPTAPAEQSPMLTWRRICGNVSSRICHEPHWLLQRPAGWCAESGDGHRTSCNGSWTPQHVSSATCGRSSTTVWRTFDTFYTGWMYQNASHSSYQWRQREFKVGGGRSAEGDEPLPAWPGRGVWEGQIFLWSRNGIFW